ncbi:unnamed protein product [Pieris macdunnoughi]|uniref:Uncharacterized protein n=1 Tax=Pieris macdunnoughi TaxID=345717 RepID=A0A821PD89_9NEOP|nr:unnamed protein product [Pieris macdunnoughi]
MEQFKLLSSRRALTEGMETNHQLVEEVFLLALFLVSTAGNSLSLLVFCRRPGLRTISNRYSWGFAKPGIIIRYVSTWRQPIDNKDSNLSNFKKTKHSNAAMYFVFQH